MIICAFLCVNIRDNSGFCSVFISDFSVISSNIVSVDILGF